MPRRYMAQTDQISPLSTIKSAPMGVRQWLVVFICIGALALDGYDVLSIAFAAPGLSAEWGITKAQLGLVLPMDLIGMAIGAIGIGNMTDKFGRRPIMLLCMIILTIGMLIAGLAPNIFVLAAARVFTGIGIGGLIACATATSSEFCNDKNRSLAVVLVAGGFPLGIYLGATFLGPILKQYDWRSTFYLGAIFSTVFFPLIYFFVPETVSYLDLKRPKNALKRIQTIMTKLGHKAPKSLPDIKIDEVVSTSASELFKPNIKFTTLILSFGYFGNIGTYYFFVKWLPTIIVDLGHNESQAAAVIGVVSLGGVVGSILMSIAARKIHIKSLMMFSMIAAAIGVCVFPFFTDSLDSMKAIGFVVGMLIFAAVSGFLGLFAASFPTHLLGSGTGIALGIGRGGAVLGPILPGFLFAAGLGFATVSITMAMGSFMAGILLLWLPKLASNKAGHMV